MIIGMKINEHFEIQFYNYTKAIVFIFLFLLCGKYSSLLERSMCNNRERVEMEEIMGLKKCKF